MVIVNFFNVHTPVSGGRYLMKKFILVLAGLALSGIAVAGPSWTYVDLGYVQLDSGDESSDGFRLSGSLGIADMFHVNANYAQIDDAFFGLDDYDSYRIGAGIHPAVTDSTDLVVELGYTSGDFDDADVEPDFIDLTFGVRSMLTDSFELNAAIVAAKGSLDTGGDDDFTDTGIRVGGQYFFTDAFSANVSATNGFGGSDGNIAILDDSVQIGVRWSFGDIL
jgi:hypothetical protein